MATSWFSCGRNKCLLFLLLISVIYYIIILLVFKVYETEDYIVVTRSVRKILQRSIELRLQVDLKESEGIQCDIPKIDPYDEEIRKIIQNIATINKDYKIQCEGVDWVRCELSSCKVRPEILDRMLQVKCKYREILFITDRRHAFGLARTRIGDAQYILKDSDHVEISCIAIERNNNVSRQWLGYAVGFRNLTRVKPDPDRVDSINIVMLGFDSTSKNSFLRSMPRTVQRLREDVEAVIMNAYNVVGYATPATLFPLLTGHTELELPDHRKAFSGAYVDDFPFIFKRLNRDGYRTAYFEDSPNMGTFQLRFNGFYNQPADHYLRHFFLLANDLNRNNVDWLSDQYYCIGDTPSYLLMLNKTEEFMKLDGKKFAFTFISDVTQDRQMLSATDQDVSDWLMRFKQQGHLGNTLLVLHSDHGPRRESLRRTFTGKLEERLPFLAIILPDSYKRANPQAIRHLRDNSERLTTPHDLYATYVHMTGLYEYLNLYRIPGSSLLRGMSLLEPIPKSRKCAEAGIEVHYCACVKWSNVSKSDPMYQRSAEALVQYINSLTDTAAARSLCATRALKSIEYVLERTPDKKLLTFNGFRDKSDFIPEFLKKDIALTDKTTYSVKIVTGPGDGVYESTMVYFETEDRFELDYLLISRVNSYNQEPSCLRETYPHLNMFCYCRQYLNN